MVGLNKWRKMVSVKSPKSSLLGQLGNFIPTIISGSALRIFFRLCSMIGYNQERKINQAGISQKILLWAKCVIFA